MKRSARRTEQCRANKSNLLWRKIRPSRFLLVLTAGDRDAVLQDLRNQDAHVAAELLIYRNKSGKVVQFGFRKFRYRGTLAGFIGRILSAHVGKSAKSQISKSNHKEKPQ